jgi:tRNA A-37 threonylcarbamoyl transferase component Bud32
MTPEPPRCARCGTAFLPEQIEGDFAGICPRCLAGLLATDPIPGEVPSERSRTIRPPLQPGGFFRGFEILEVLGQGGMGVVYKARQQSLHRLVALKLLNPQLASSEEFSKRFEREARVLATLNHPNVVQVYDFGREDETLYLAMEHVDGPTLDDVLKQKPLNRDRFLGTIRDVARGLQRIHEAGLVHRDIKPSNLLLTLDGAVKITDFGLAIETEETQKLTDSGMFLGTPHYVSPEHAQGQKLDGRSDLYALGVILFEGFAGRLPFQAPTAAAILLKHINESPPPLRKIAPESPKSVQKAVRKLLAKKPADRYGTAEELASDLDHALGEVGHGRGEATPRAGLLKIGAGAGVLAAILAVVLLLARFPGGSGPAPAGVPETGRGAKGAIDLLPLIDVTKDAYVGSWTLSQGALHAPSTEDQYSLIRLPVIPPAEYDLVIQAEVSKPLKSLDLGLVLPSGMVDCVLDGWSRSTSALHQVDWKSGESNETSYRHRLFGDAKPRTILCSVRSGGITVSVDGTAIIQYHGSLDRLALDGAFHGPVSDRRCFFIGAWGPYLLRRIELIGVSGAAKFLRDASPKAAESTSPSDGSVDLLSLVDVTADAVEGDWYSDARGLVSEPGQHVRLQLPYIPPDEYDLRVVVERKEGSDGIAFGLARGDAQWTVYVDKYPTEGWQSGFELLDNGDSPVVRGQQIPIGRPVTFDFKVREDGFTVLKDGDRFIEWKGDRNRLRNFARWEMPNSRTLFLGQWSSRTRFRSVTLTPVTGRGTPLPPARRPAKTEVPPTTIDLMGLIRTGRDVVTGSWSKKGGRLISDDQPFNRLAIPYEPPAEYDLQMTFTRLTGTQDINQIFVAGGRQLIWSMNAGDGRYSGFAMVKGQWADGGENPTRGPSPKIPPGGSHSTVLQVRKTGIKVTFDGQLWKEWTPDWFDVEMTGAWGLGREKVLGLGTFQSSIAFEKIEVVEVSGPGKPLVARELDLPPNAVDLLKSIDPARDARNGSWKFSNGALIADGHSSSKMLRLDIPSELPEEYDLVAVVEREDETTASDFFVTLVGGGHPFAFSIDAYAGTRSGIFDIDHQTPLEGMSRAGGKFFRGGVPRTIVFSVRKDSLTVTADGHEFYVWKGGWNRVSLNPVMAGKGPFGIGVLGCTFRILTLVLIPVAP